MYYLVLSFLVLTACTSTGTLDNRTGVFESIQCGRAKLDRWEREPTPTSMAASLLLPDYIVAAWIFD